MPNGLRQHWKGRFLAEKIASFSFSSLQLIWLNLHNAWTDNQT
jgi:hypothetical protein